MKRTLVDHFLVATERFNVKLIVRRSGKSRRAISRPSGQVMVLMMRAWGSEGEV